MTLVNAVKTAGRAVRANLLPGLLLQSLMIVFFMAYAAHEGTRQFLAQVADFKHEAGYSFAFVSYILAAAVLPEVLRIGFFQGCRIYRKNLWNIVTAAPIWGGIGLLVDLFYRFQEMWFGAGNVWTVVVLKMAVDQFVFSPFLCTPLNVGALAWRDEKFRPSALKNIVTQDFYFGRVFPIQVGGWLIWIPGVCLVYFMPSSLQLPVAVLIQTFWVLIFTTIGERVSRQAESPLLAQRRAA